MRKLALIFCSVVAALAAADAQLPSQISAASGQPADVVAIAPHNSSITKLEFADDPAVGISAANLTAIPEPATYMLMGLGVLICAQQFRRKKS